VDEFFSLLELVMKLLVAAVLLVGVFEMVTRRRRREQRSPGLG